MEEKQITLQIDRHYITVPEGSTENRYRYTHPLSY